MRELHRSETDKWIAGVCGGIGETYSFDPITVRLIAIALCLVFAILPFAFVYIIA
ncbi:PspC domain-containing protein [Chloroflexota bacterium]